MKVQLFIPCYIDQFYPRVGIATYELLRKLGCDVHYPTNQTCCGQPMANAGYNDTARACNEHFIKCFDKDRYIVCPSGSCTLHIKEHLKGKEIAAAAAIRYNIYELTEFITDVLKVKPAFKSFNKKVGMHVSCHGQRGLALSSMSEQVSPAYSKPASLLNSIAQLELVHPKRPDECCGFGGTFCVTEPAVSVKMGKDRLLEHLMEQVEVITGNDMSCLMHLEGIIARNNYPLSVMHIAEILNQALPA